VSNGRSGRGRRPAGYCVLVAAGLIAVSACTGPGADQAAQAADSFARLVPDDPGKACDLLAPRTREEVEKAAEKTCAEALPDEDLPDPSAMLSVEVYGHDAIARFGNDTVFLARFPEGWRITAAGCQAGPSDAKPYDCDISGG
jgi:hypothetical protein